MGRPKEIPVSVGFARELPANKLAGVHWVYSEANSMSFSLPDLFFDFGAEVVLTRALPQFSYPLKGLLRRSS
jgi:peptidoglycan biosynthesis protein MviN/MurJ (putative lipid II flippase)